MRNSDVGPSSPGNGCLGSRAKFRPLPTRLGQFVLQVLAIYGTNDLVACQRAVKQLCGTHSPERNRPEHLHGSTNVVASSCETAHIYAHFQDASGHNATGTGQQARSR